MALSFSHLNVVWLKRDLRLRDHEPLWRASQNPGPVILIYVIEPIMLNDPHMDIRHWRFIWQSLKDIDEQLKPFDTQVQLLTGDMTQILMNIRRSCTALTLYSYQEIGLAHTFERDKMLHRYCKQHDIQWQEACYGAVARGLASRHEWEKQWRGKMRAATYDVNLTEIAWLTAEQAAALSLPDFSVPDSWQEPDEHFQLGGEKRAWHALHHFFKGRGKDYYWAISKPEASRKACSRLSPYLAWGNMSLRQMYQTLLQHWNTKGWRRALAALSSRLHWHCHFIQKFESECAMEFRPVNKAYLEFPYESGQHAQTLLEHWRDGTTGIPLIDACMRCVSATGYLNFRMRAMLVSFLTHHLNVDWRLGVIHLGKQFLDFEPGIHYTQFQMQAGITGINLIRVYNPVKQAQDHDPEALFIKKWLPELASLPSELAIQPWLLSPMEQQMYQVTLGRDYPEPIVDVVQSGKLARDRLWEYRKRQDVKNEAQHILQVHTVPQNRHKYRRG
ncbi:MAG: deoxyribodipyrimidine photo-lyase/cryptochrome family protein [Aestuariibacter sp.]